MGIGESKCQYVFKKGERKGQKCGEKATVGDRCELCKDKGKKKDVNKNKDGNKVKNSIEKRIEKPKYKKQKISQALRNKVWSLNNPWKGVCYTCGLDITISNCHMGHIVAESKGGTTTENNLRAICMTCNTSMGVNNMIEWAQRLGLKGPYLKDLKK